MKKTAVICAGLCLAFTLTSCKSTENAYRKIYDKALAEEATATPAEEPVFSTPVVTVQQPVTQPAVNADDVAVRSENLSVVNGNGLSMYSVVVGSFGVKANAERLQTRLINSGYSAQLAFNADHNMYRVVAFTSNDKAAAVSSRTQLQQKFPGEFKDAWLLKK